MDTYPILYDTNSSSQLSTPELKLLLATVENTPIQLDKEEENSELQFVAILSSN